MGNLLLEKFSGKEQNYPSQAGWQRYARIRAHHHAQDNKWGDLAAVGVFAVMLLEMLLPIKSTSSIKALFILMGICAWKGRWPLSSRGLLLMAIAAGAYLLTACLSGWEYRVVWMDILVIAQTGLLMAFLGMGRFDQPRRERFFTSLHVTFLVLGVACAACGLAKLFLDSRGIQLPFIFDEQGRYPAGSSLQLDYNIFTSALILALCSTFWLMPRTRSRLVLYLCYMGWPLLAASAILTGSRRAPLFLSLSLIIWLIVTIRRRSRSHQGDNRGPGLSVNRWAMSFYFLVVSCVALYAPPVRRALDDLAASNQVTSLLDRSSTVGNVAELFDTRVIFWEYSLHELSNRDVPSLITGDGFSYVPQLGSLTGEAEAYPHNFVLSSMLYGGLLQTLLLLSVVGAGFVRSMRTENGERFLSFWLLVAVLFNLSSSNSFFSSELGLAALVLALDAPRRHRAPVRPALQTARPRARFQPYRHPSTI